MRVFKAYGFREGIKGVRLGWSLAGPPLMSVFCYCFDRVMVDTGQAHMGKEAAAFAGEHRVDRIFLTHHHEDHSGNAALIRKMTGARVFGQEQTIRKMKTRYPVLPYQKYVWGRTTPVPVEGLPDRIDTSLGPLIPVPTPGHSRDHTAYFLPDQGILFSGDLYLGDRIKYFRSDENLIHEIASLKRVLALAFDQLLCGHNPQKEGGKAHIRAKLQFLEDLCGRVVDCRDKGYPEKEIFARLALKEDRFTKWFCFGNVSMMHGVRSILRHHDGGKDA